MHLPQRGVPTQSYDMMPPDPLCCPRCRCRSPCAVLVSGGSTLGLAVACQINLYDSYEMNWYLPTCSAAPAACRPAPCAGLASGVSAPWPCCCMPTESYDMLLTHSAAPAACCRAPCAGLASGVSAPADPNLPEGIPLDAADSSKVSIRHKENRQGVSCTCAWVEES